MTSPEIIFLAPLPAFRKRTRLVKIVSVLRERGLAVRLFGWEREAGEAHTLRWEDPEVTEDVLLRGGGYGSGRTRRMYPIWMWRVFWKVLRLGRDHSQGKKHPRTLFCLGWETAFPARLAAIFTGARIIFDDADRFSMILKLPGPLHRMLQGLEKWTSRRVALHIVPGMARYDWRHDRMVVLRNTPLAADFAAARAAAPPRPDHALVLYANGWLGETRGAPVLLAALNGLRDRGVDAHMVIAGRVDSPAGAALIAHQDVTYLGEVNQQVALAQYPGCDLALTLYDPAVPINRMAESNKWGDCAFFDTPFVVNTEVETAQSFADAGACWQVDYADTTGLVDLLAALAADPDRLAQAATALSTLKDIYAPFDVQLDSLFTQIQLPGWEKAPKPDE